MGGGLSRGKGVWAALPLPHHALGFRTPGSPESGTHLLRVGGLWRAGQGPPQQAAVPAPTPALRTGHLGNGARLGNVAPGALLSRHSPGET